MPIKEKIANTFVSSILNSNGRDSETWTQNALLYHILTLKSRQQPCISSISQKLHIIKTKFCISSLRKWYNLRLMRCTFGDDIHAKAWWYTIAFAMDKKDYGKHIIFHSLFVCKYLFWYNLRTPCQNLRTVMKNAYGQIDR